MIVKECLAPLTEDREKPLTGVSAGQGPGMAPPIGLEPITLRLTVRGDAVLGGSSPFKTPGQRATRMTMNLPGLWWTSSAGTHSGTHWALVTTPPDIPMVCVGDGSDGAVGPRRHAATGSSHTRVRRAGRRSSSGSR